jgi:hypothetical protein
MMRSDWQFRRTVIPAIIQALLFPLIAVVRGLGHSPFDAGAPTIAQFLPHLGGIVGLPLCGMLAYSDQHRASWIFLTAPLESLRSFARGVFWAIWVPVSALPLMMFPLCAWYWGIRDALLFLGYSLTVGSLYLGVEIFLLEGLPFGNAPRAGKASMAGPLIIVAFIAAAVIVGLQWVFIFKSRFVTLSAGLLFGGMAFAVSQLSLHYLETNILHNLHIIASGRMAMFKELE